MPRTIRSSLVAGVLLVLVGTFVQVRAASTPRIDAVRPGRFIEQSSGTIRIEVIGGNFATGVQVRVRSTNATSVQRVSSRQLVAVVPRAALPPGSHTVTVTNPDGGAVQRRSAVTIVARWSVPILTAAGDIARCGDHGDAATGALIDQLPGTVLTLGDNVYDRGTATEFRDCYDPTWGAFRTRTKPTPGNHDYLTTGASAYYAYFGSRAGDPSTGYYTFRFNGWRLIAINSNCSDIGGCGAGSAQYAWLTNVLATNSDRCTLAYWHHPRFSSGQHGNDTGMDAVWRALANAGVDVVLNGHDHDYERFARLDANGTPSDSGVRSFVVGTGGGALRSFGTVRAGSEVRIAETYGALKLNLRSDGYDWRFLGTNGTALDSGTELCR